MPIICLQSASKYYYRVLELDTNKEIHVVAIEA